MGIGLYCRSGQYLNAILYRSRGLDLLTVSEDMLQTVKTQLQQKIGSSDDDFWIGLYARKWVSTYSGESGVTIRLGQRWRNQHGLYNGAVP